jgi:transcriptional regulator
MYEQAHFRVEDRAELVALIRAYPLGLLVAPRENGFFASADLMPFVVDDAGETLRAHIARNNPLAAALAEPCAVLVVFQGPQAYVSPWHYPGKKAHGRVVPTWNYVMAQAEGVARLRDEADWKGAQAAALTDRQEQDREKPWAVADAPEPYVAAQLRGVIGLEIAISSLAGKYKLSQNRDEADRAGVIAGLPAEGGAAAATARFMARREPGKIG